jgi:glycine/D-amino acid oxidase-like deaminating enzyme/nitrite reductase/ring-hydroxylating ferredoxin subunit
MNISIAKEMSIWAGEAIPAGPALDRNIATDVCIIGAGIAGLSVAYHLGRAGKRVVIIDDGTIGGGQTCMTTAHLSNELDDRYVNIERMHGEELSRLAAESHTAAIDRIEQIVREELIDCDFQRLDGYLFSSPEDKDNIIREEFLAAIRTGCISAELMDKAPLHAFDTGQCIRFMNQAQFHPLKYLARLAEAIQRNGGLIYSNTHAANIVGGPSASVQTSAGPVVTARDVVIATNVPINDLFVLHTKQAPYHTYVIGAKVPAGVVHKALYWDTEDPYHYVRLQHEPRSRDGELTHEKAYDILMIGGEDHESGQADDGQQRYDRLEQRARAHFPAIEDIEYRWSGQVMESNDGLAYIGHNPLDQQNIYIATGDSGMGMTHGTIAGMLISDLILGKETPWAKVYDPRRKRILAAGDFAKENLNVALQYTDWLTAGDVDSPDRVKPRQGAIMRRGLSKVAIYRREDGSIVELSAVCPHLMCIVAWNSADSTWDCPCHGSRFTAEGKVINGPANVDLKRLN